MERYQEEEGLLDECQRMRRLLAIATGYDAVAIKHGSVIFTLDEAQAACDAERASADPQAQDRYSDPFAFPPIKENW